MSNSFANCCVAMSEGHLFSELIPVPLFVLEVFLSKLNALSRNILSAIVLLDKSLKSPLAMSC